MRMSFLLPRAFTVRSCVVTSESCVFTFTFALWLSASPLCSNSVHQVTAELQPVDSLTRFYTLAL